MENLYSDIFTLFGVCISACVALYVSKQERKLKKRLDEKMEKLRVEYVSLYPKRVATIEALYSILYDIGRLKSGIYELPHTSTECNQNFSDQMSNEVDKLLFNIREFEELINRNKIYLSIETINKLNGIIHIFKQFQDSYEFYRQEHDNDIMGFMSSEHNTIFPDNLDVIISEVEDEFRTLIGD